MSRVQIKSFLQKNHVKCVQSNYISNNKKVAVIIDFLCALLGMIVSNAENAIDSLNGQLDSLTYKGYSCGSCSNSDCKKNSNRSKKNV